jgi:multiple sugar transport system permease protein
MTIARARARGRRSDMAGWLFVAPAMALALLLVVYPFIYNFWLSFVDRTARRSGGFVGLDNYADLLSDADFYWAALRTVLWTAGTVIVQIVLGLALALFLNRSFRGRGFARASLLIPYALSTVTIVFIWRWLLNDINGVVNFALLNLGAVGSPVVFLNGPVSAMATTIMVAVWQATPLTVLLILAGLQSIPNELYDACRVDGGRRLHEFWHVTLPMLRPVLGTIALIKTIWTFNWFDLIWLFTAGGPADATRTLAVAVYEQGFRQFQFSQAAAIGVLMFVLIALIATPDTAHPAGGARNVRNPGRRAEQWLWNAGVAGAGVVMLGFVLFPIYFLIVSSLRPPEHLFDPVPAYLPNYVSLEFYRIAVTEAPILVWTANSVLVVCGTVLLTMPLAILAAYGLTRFDIRGRRLLSRFVLVLYMFPSVLLLVPIFVVMAKIGLVNTLAGLILAHATFALPFGIWYLSACMRGIPKELDEAGLLDGCNRLTLLWHVLLPVMLPGIAAATAFVFMLSWNEYAFAVTLIQKAGLRTLPLGVASYLSVQGIPWGVVLATSVLMSIPVVLAVQLAQRYFVSGLTAGAVKA